MTVAIVLSWVWTKFQYICKNVIQIILDNYGNGKNAINLSKLHTIEEHINHKSIRNGDFFNLKLFL
jgi:hypothetical protein